MIDAIDIKILTIAQKNARIPNAEIARRVGLAASAVFERLRKLEERGVIRGYHADVDPQAADLGQLAFIFIRSNDRPGGSDTAARLAAFPEFLELHHVAGEDCFLAKVRTRDTDALGQLLRELGAIPSITSTRTTVVLGSVKETVLLPLAGEAADSREARHA